MDEYCRCDVSIPDVSGDSPPVLCSYCGLPWALEESLRDRITGRTFREHFAAGGLVALPGILSSPVVIAAGQVVAAPGLAEISECDQHGGPGCLECGGTGHLVWHACIRCGDIGTWRYDDDSRLSMSCGRCGASWLLTDPAWIAQRVPERLLYPVAA